MSLAKMISILADWMRAAMRHYKISYLVFCVLLLAVMIISCTRPATVSTPAAVPPSRTPLETPTPAPSTTPVHSSTPDQTPRPTPAAVENYFSGYSPGELGLAITSDGKRAYITFASDDALLVVDLSTFNVINSIDVSAAGNMLVSNAAVLSPDGKKLYVSNYGTRNMMVVDTENKRVEKVLPLKPKSATAISISRDGSKAYVTSEKDGLYIINTSDYSYSRIFLPGVIFGPVVPSPSNSDLLYTVGRLTNLSGTLQPSFFVFNVSSNSVVRSSNLPDPVLLTDNARVSRIFINPNETRAYFGSFTFGTDKGVGNFSFFDLNIFQVSASTSINNGVTDFAVNEKTGKIYIIGFSAGGGASQKSSILEYDISTNRVVHQIPISPSTDQRAIAVDPTNANYLYMTEGDFNFIRKVEISTGKETDRVQFNKADIRPRAIIRGDNNTGYIVSPSLRRAYKLDLSSGQLSGSIELPLLNAGWGFYQGKLYIGTGSDIYAINPNDGSIIERYHLATEFSSLNFTFFGDKMAAINFETMMVGRRLLIFDARTMSILKSIELPRETYGDKVIVSPDGSKFYITRGPMFGGAVTITVFNASTLDIIKTIQIPPSPHWQGATGFVEADFDETNKILYLTGFMSVYKINMDTDELVGTLDVIGAYESQKIYGWGPSGLCGVMLSQSKDKLFVISGDAHSIYTYDLINSSWATRIINLRGYFVTDAVWSPDRQYLYTVNQDSDSVTVVDLTSGDIVRIIRL